jgi:hypothetical protein
MRNILLIITFLLSRVIISQTNPNHTYQKGYVKKDGKYVEGHYKTEKNKTEKDNFVSKPNTNPYNGKKGYKKPKK